MRATYRTAWIRIRFSLAFLLALFVPAALFSGLVVQRVLHPPPVDVRMSWGKSVTVDLGGERPAYYCDLRIDNVSDSAVWYVGNSSQTLCYAYYAEKPSDNPLEWGGSASFCGISEEDLQAPWKLPWTRIDGNHFLVHSVPLEPGEYTTVGWGFTTEVFPRRIHWVFSPTVRLVEEGGQLVVKVEGFPQREVVLPAK